MSGEFLAFVSIVWAMYAVSGDGISLLDLRLLLSILWK